MLNGYSTLYASPAALIAIKHAANADKAAIDYNPIFSTLETRLAGIMVRTHNLPPEEVFDWSECRSPSRAKRRHARGIPQRVKISYNEVAFLVNEDAFTKAAANVAERVDTMLMKQLYGDWLS